MSVGFQPEESLLVIPYMIYEYYTLGVIDLVLENPRQETFGGQTQRFTLQIQSFEPDFRITRDFAVDVADTQAALEIFLYNPFILGNLGVDEDQEAAVILIIEVIAYYDDFEQLVDLYGSQGDSHLMFTAILPIKGCHLHILDQLPDLVAYQPDFFGRLPQPFMRQADDEVF